VGQFEVAHQESLAVAVGLDDPLRLDEFLETIAPDAGDGLALSIGPWHIDLVATAVRTSVLTALVAGVLIPHGLGDFAVGTIQLCAR
jgi:hypothetical protein